MDTTSSGAGARDVRAHNGGGRPRDQRSEHTCAGRERSAARGGGWDEGPFGVCGVGLLRRVQLLPWETA